MQLDREVQDYRKETGAIENSLCLDYGPNLFTFIISQGPKNDNKHMVTDVLKELKSYIIKLININRNIKQSKVSFIVRK